MSKGYFSKYKVQDTAMLFIFIRQAKHSEKSLGMFSKIWEDIL